jgi:mRNA-degrading endonuclease toxin of MazEF toxin-antitoxin module
MSMTIAEVKRGEAHYADLNPVVGRVTGKTRPVVVIDNDIGNQYSPTTIVAIIRATPKTGPPIRFVWSYVRSRA